MRVYNIQNGKEFFERIASCIGSVELIREDGQHIRITPGKNERDFLPLTCFQYNIDQLELKFENPADFLHMMSYISRACCC